MSDPVPDTRSDAELLGAYRTGGVRAFEVLYVRHRRAVFRFGLRFARDAALADDVVQECFRELVDRADTIEIRGSLSGWLYVVAKRTALRLRDRAERHQGDPSELSTRVDTERSSSPTVDTGDLSRLVDTLPEAQREVVLLRYVDDWTLEAIAAALDVPLGTVKSRLHHAVRAMRERYDGE